MLGFHHVSLTKMTEQMVILRGFGGYGLEAYQVPSKSIRLEATCEMVLIQLASHASMACMDRSNRKLWALWLKLSQTGKRCLWLLREVHDV